MEEKRQKLVWIIFGVFLAIIFEGVLRKWVTPSLHQYFFFIRDPFVVLAYAYAFYADLTPRQGTIFYLVIFFTITISFFSFFQTLYSHLPWWIIAYSWRTHFLMLPLTLIIGSFVNAKDLKRLFRFTLRLTPIYVVLVYFQSISPQDHWINAGWLGLFQPLGVGALIRTEGFFTSSVGNAIFVGFLVVILLSMWLREETWNDIVNKKEQYTFAVFTAAILVMSGQRTTFLLVGLIILAGFLASLASSRQMLIKFLKPVLSLITLATILLIFVFPQHRKAIYSRFNTSYPGQIAGYDLVERTVYDLSSFYKEFATKIPDMGLGIGYSSNAAYVYNITVVDLVSENEWGRHIIELGPYFGFFVIVFRIFMFLYLLFLCLRFALIHKDPVPFMFFTLLAPFLLFGQLTGNGIASGFIWFLAGVVLSLLADSINTEQSHEILNSQQTTLQSK